MEGTKLGALMDLAADAQRLIQQDYEQINPIVGAHTRLREQGIPADAMTIDCPQSGKRIVVMILDANPEQIVCTFGFKDKDADESTLKIAFSDIKMGTIYQWIESHFSSN
ncbi:hypothetical protein EZV61_18645 [Corallincola luteus]|uniref:Uncharacterized protein n=1 Tax=Corallincola luteus TaxID=1775177 RepID=A0ABY2AI44_9GAMM|nr:hypothetical protein [Corallincola luteus]TCI01294.1 hypothetical protein EZV61_18645 [Corallincola luteus]